jgi:hypothetical protein
MVGTVNRGKAVGYTVKTAEASTKDINKAMCASLYTPARCGQVYAALHSRSRLT